jgi:WD40 repeat protein
LKLAYLPYAQLNRANLQETKFIGADLTGTNLEQSNLDKANFGGAKLQKANFDRASLQQAYLHGCQLQMANFNEANLQKANLTDAKCEGANFTKTDLRGAKIDLAKDANVEFAITGDLDQKIEHSLYLELDIHSDSFAFSPDSKTIAYCNRNNNITLFDINSHKKTIEFNIQPEPIVSVVFSEDGLTLHQHIYINDLKIWNLSTGKLINNLKNHSANITALVLNSKAEIIYMTGIGEPDRTFDVGHEILTIKGYSAVIKTEAHSPDGKLIARSNHDRNFEVELLNSQTGKKIRTFTEYQQPVQSLAFSPDSKLLATKSVDDIRIYQINTGEKTYSHSNEAYSSIYRRYQPTIGFTQIHSVENSVLFTSYLCSSFSQNNATQRDRQGIEFDWNVSSKSFSSTGRVAISADSKILARQYNEESVQIWDLQIGKELASVNLNSESDYLFELNPIGNILTFIRNEREIILWDIQTNSLINKLTSHSGNICVLQFSPDGKTLAVGCKDFTITLWNLENSTKITKLRGFSSCYALAFSPNKPILASGSSDGTITIWDLDTSLEIHNFSGHNKFDSYTKSLEFSPNGKWLASKGKEGKLRLWTLD